MDVGGVEEVFASYDEGYALFGVVDDACEVVTDLEGVLVFLSCDDDIVSFLDLD